MRRVRTATHNSSARHLTLREMFHHLCNTVDTQLWTVFSVLASGRRNRRRRRWRLNEPSERMSMLPTDIIKQTTTTANTKTTTGYVCGGSGWCGWWFSCCATFLHAYIFEFMEHCPNLWATTPPPNNTLRRSALLKRNNFGKCTHDAYMYSIPEMVYDIRRRFTLIPPRAPKTDERKL